MLTSEVVILKYSCADKKILINFQMHSRISIVAFKKTQIHRPRLLVQDLNWHLFNQKKTGIQILGVSIVQKIIETRHCVVLLHLMQSQITLWV